jgi:hypothetical protein
MRLVCALAVVISFSPGVEGDDYITLTAKVDHTEFKLHDENLGHYNGDWEKAFAALTEDIESGNYATKHEDYLKLEKGEVVDLIQMYNVSSKYISPPQISELNNGNHRWRGNQNFQDADGKLASGGYKFEVKYPRLDRWFSLTFDAIQRKWTGLGTLNPTIIGPCELRLTQYANIILYSTYDHSDRNTLTRFGTQYAGGIAWVSLKKLKTTSLGSSTTGQSLVLPEGSGDLDIVMEGSNDLINWTREELGRKTTTNRKRFYRLRAVKE